MRRAIERPSILSGWLGRDEGDEHEKVGDREVFILNETHAPVLLNLGCLSFMPRDIADHVITLWSRLNG